MNAARTKDGTLLNLNKNKIIDIVNSDYFVAVREEMSQNQKPPACSRCYKEEENLFQSKRQLELSRFGKGTFDMFGPIEPNFKFIELRLGNLCNVKCRTCNPGSSSQWVTEYNKLQEELKFVTHYDKINSDWTESDEFWDELLDHSKNLELIYINGGEPTLVEKHWNYLERLIERGLHKQVKLWYSINMTNVPDKLLEIWRQFKEVEVHASIDDLYERNTYIRKGTKWNDVEENLKKLIDTKWINLSVTQTVSWMNAYYVKEFREYFDKMGITVNTNYVYDPKFYNIAILPESIKEQLVNIVPKDILNHMSTDISHTLLQQGFEYNKWLDNSRNEDFATTFSEWAKLLGY
jgi:organic radical activating enzyme